MPTDFYNNGKLPTSYLRSNTLIPQPDPKSVRSAYAAPNRDINRMTSIYFNGKHYSTGMHEEFLQDIDTEVTKSSRQHPNPLFFNRLRHFIANNMTTESFLGSTMTEVIRLFAEQGFKGVGSPNPCHMKSLRDQDTAEIQTDRLCEVDYHYKIVDDELLITVVYHFKGAQLIDEGEKSRNFIQQLVNREPEHIFQAYSYSDASKRHSKFEDSYYYIPQGGIATFETTYRISLANDAKCDYIKYKVERDNARVVSRCKNNFKLPYGKTILELLVEWLRSIVTRRQYHATAIDPGLREGKTMPEAPYLADRQGRRRFDPRNTAGMWPLPAAASGSGRTSPEQHTSAKRRCTDAHDKPPLYRRGPGNTIVS